MLGCAVNACGNYNRATKGSNIRYYRFPKDKALAKQWIAACKRYDVINIKNGITMRQAENIEHYIEEQKRRKIDIDIDIGDITISNLNVKEEILTEPNTEESTDVLTSLELLETDENDNIETIQLHVDENRNIVEGHIGPLKILRQLFLCGVLAPSDITISNLNVKEEILTEPNTEESTDVLTSLELSETDENNNIETIQLHVDENRNIDRNEMSTLKKRIEELEKENLTLLREIQENYKKYDHLKKNLELFFTNGQMKRLMDSKCGRAHWSPKDIASAISLRSVSPKAYRYLKRTGYPLPALSTLRRWASSFSVDTGVLYDVMKLLKTKANSLSKLKKLCVLSFDEIYVSNRVDIEKREQQRIGPHMFRTE
ncbi:THAP domain [Popillia japonica]|uniref:THAP domain n=1 Tax=Popillia japonica TaxID=7064 RepID=A0AAW1LVW6_POPJA